MKYRNSGKLNTLDSKLGQVSALGIGTMRLPTTGEPGDIDEPAAEEMICHAIDAGANYVDTAYPYHEGNSERVVGKVLANGYRDKVSLATKMPSWAIEKTDDFDRYLNEQLEKLQTEHIDFYLLHCLKQPWWHNLRDLGVLDWAEKAKADGRIGRLGFSFHDTLDSFKEIIDAGDWAFCQIQYNYACENVQAGTEGLQYAAEKDIAVVVMEPLFGGSLVALPEPLRKIWDENAAEGTTPVDLALQWLWDKPEVSLVLTGASSLEQMKENLASADRSGVGTLGEADRRLVELLQAAHEELKPTPCSKCGYCMPCPNGVNIPMNIDLHNAASVLKNTTLKLSRTLYSLLPEEQRAGNCVSCGECEEKCPQSIEIPEVLARVHEDLKADE